MNKTISDQQLVDYILRLLPENVHSELTQQINSDNLLQQRLAQWEQILFQFNEQTEAIRPPKAVWQNIERHLFPESATSPKRNKKQGFGHYLIPAFFSLALLFMGSFYFAHRPSYQAEILAAQTQQAIWSIEGNDKHITFTSLKSVAVKNRDCQAWIIQANNPPQRLGIIPDTGDKSSKRIRLPETLSVGAGDKIIIVMTRKNYKEKLPPAGAPIMKSTVLAAI